ncbi:MULTISPECIES: TetR/AcrR family transcriptional regulator [unclassified Oceanobacter]|uniref:TetR/AcrR family transcriptional regulator n=1 Tax=unclassified Oceanobacter TaxID=2620260 RepID=UPI0026E2EA73|nr:MULTISPECIES: TetR/AcrR family transcriptional regulator [unclassified Oceanobacter]MDO6682443.1 TetR/AcrR family transcriptional regulator [Oceanobacter sp. 5_MG-2023]MDP2506389.1 TetR/AcrR family transcriptional regulator [Oceanobacter sp. 3_MG-2023]MDP2548804.1 TetR/AcrR family transcriptional regulator [Oceanobacter sp. 4_MG-2023]MDP2609229.1 TetR/AcrR family transcriptional regulator [Oceanobacter sp. 1_MG-2023]MDP2612479.1 TetR/AcrR family transcriptional regulator [Oceanobacter sp. 2
MSHAKHDRQEAIHNATQLFWAKGFHATSMRNIQQAMDMRPGSIYASFGSKEGLFKEVLGHYAAMSKARLRTSVEQAGSPLAGLKAFVKGAVCSDPASTPSSMCMLVKTITELTDDNADLLAEAKYWLAEMEAAFAEVLTQARASGETAATADPERQARYLQVQLMGLRSYARARPGECHLDELVDDVFEHLRG